MVAYPGFIGGTDTVLSKNWNVERTINWFREAQSPTALAKTPAALLATPGLRPFIVLDDAPLRGLFFQDDRLFAVAGTSFYEITEEPVATKYGTVANDAHLTPVTMCSNGSDGHQVFIVSSGHGYIFDLVSNAFTEISDPNFPVDALMGAFLDGYFLVLQKGTDTFFQSAPEDGLVWDGTNVGQSNQSSDVTRALIVDHREIWLFGSKTTSVWYNAGAPNFPFQPISGVFLEVGITSPWSAQPIDSSIMWVGLNHQGGGVVYRAQQFQPVRVSTHAVELYLQRLENNTQLVCWTYADEGHNFYVIYGPGAETSFTYDTVTNEWHERAHWNPITRLWRPHVGRCACYAFERVLIGDRQSGAIYRQKLDLFDDMLVTSGGV